MKVKKISYFDLYGIITFLVMCITMDLSFTWIIPKSLTWILAIASSSVLLFTFRNLKTSNSNILLCFIFGIICFIMIFINPGLSRLLSLFSLWIGACTIILLPTHNKQRLLSIFTTGTVIIVAISLVGWLLFTLGVPLPHSPLIVHENGFHRLYNYYFFVVSENTQFQLFPRFSSMFLEPGQLATPCVFLIFANNLNFKSPKIIILLIAVLLSFSLVGYGILIGGLLLYSFFVLKRHRILITSSLLLLLFTFTVFLIKIENQNNPIYTFIISRLKYDEEKGISGNNRTTEYFDYKYKRVMSSSDKYLGIAREIDRNNDWTANTSGIKKFIVLYGLVNLLLLSIFFLKLLKDNWCINSIVFFIIVLVGFIPRSMLLSSYWLFICLTAVPVLKWQTSLNK